MATHYGPVPENIDEIADAFGLSEDVLVTEGIRAFVQNHLDSLEAESKTLCAKYGVATFKEMDGIVRRERTKEGDSAADFDQFDYLTERIQRMKVLLEGMPDPPKFPLPTLDQVRETLRARETVLAESYGIKVLGIYGPYAVGKPRPYDRIGLLVELLRPMGFEFFGLDMELSEFLGTPVQVSTPGTPGEAWSHRTQRIMSELVEI